MAEQQGQFNSYNLAIHERRNKSIGRSSGGSSGGADVRIIDCVCGETIKANFAVSVIPEKNQIRIANPVLYSDKVIGIALTDGVIDDTIQVQIFGSLIFDEEYMNNYPDKAFKQGVNIVVIDPTTVDNKYNIAQNIDDISTYKSIVIMGIANMDNNLLINIENYKYV